jgi:hypothetical protein
MTRPARRIGPDPRVRNSVRLAIRERIRAGAIDNPEAIAKEIVEDVIEPALIDIRRRLAAAKEVLDKKHQVTAGLAGLGTIRGLFGSPLAVPLAATAAGLGAAAEHKAIEEKREAQMSNMYFLWKVDQDSRTSKRRRTRKSRKARRGHKGRRR